MLATLVLLAAVQESAVAGPSEADPLASSRARARAHYARVEEELRAAPVELDEERRVRRAALLDALRVYRERGDFGRSEARVPVFVDDDGRRCAVAELLHVTGEDALVESVRAAANGAYVFELARDPELDAWLTRHGLTWREAARIQAPTNVAPAGPSADAPLDPGPTGRPPGATGGRGNAAAALTRSRARAIATLGRPVSPGGLAAAPSASAPSAPFTIGGVSVSDVGAHWWLWWEYNKVLWLVPEERPRWKAEESDPEETRSAERLVTKRERWAPLLAKHLRHADGSVRAAAAVALGRVGGEAAVPALVEALEDAQLSVRQSAVLALGATGSERATHHLLRLARTGRLDGSERVVPDVRELATVALALARRRGGAEGTGSMLPRDERLEEAAALASLVHADDGAAERLRDLSGLFTGTERRPRPRDARAETLAALRVDPSEEVTAALLRALGYRDLQVRRAAAATLGARRDPRSAEPLFTAFELEEEPLARGLLLVAIGRVGGAEARDFLIHVLEDGPKSSRPWCALALGICAEGLAERGTALSGDGPTGETAAEEPADVARAALRAGLAAERNQDAIGAYLLALGIARDLEAVPVLRHELETAGDPLTRSLAGLGLALTGARGVREPLRAAIEDESAPLARAALGQALALGRRPGDTLALVELMREVRLPGNQAQLAAAFAIQGAPRAADLLGDLLEEEDLATRVRATAVQALGLLLDEHEPFLIARLAEGVNHDVLPWWIDVPMQSTL